MHILVSAATASDLAETAEQSIDYLQKVIDYVISKAHNFVSAMIILIRQLVLTIIVLSKLRISTGLLMKAYGLRTVSSPTL